jgi:uncharacterized delta-60 repeat protein
MKAILLLPFVLFTLLEVAGQEGGLDQSFGSGGFVRLSQPISNTGFTSDGKLVGTFTDAGGKINLIRYNIDGTVDASYGNAGVIQLPYTTSFIKISVLNNSDVLVARDETTYSATGRYGYDELVVTLYSPNGSVRELKRIGPYDYRVAPLPTPLALFNYNDESWLAYRGFSGSRGYYTTITGVLGGAPDLPFRGSLRTTSSSNDAPIPYSLTVANVGKIYVGGTETGYFDNASSITTRLVIQRFNSNGMPDSTYGTNSVVASSLGAGISNLVVQNDGKLLGSFVDQNGSPTNKLIRFNVDGSIDVTFGGSGVVTTPFNINKISLQADSRMIVAGTLNGDFALARYNTIGTLDPAFGVNGTTTTDFGGIEGITDMTIAGSRIYTYGTGILAAYNLVSTCIAPTFQNNNLIILDANCNNNDGAINIIPTSGVAPFMYSINGGVTYVAGPSAGYGFQNLAAGTYQLRLKDANGCVSAIVERTIQALNCAPVITSIVPSSGPVGTTVTISGTGFDAVAANNDVYFGAVKATVVSATPTTITVKAPAGSTYGPITVTTNGRTGSLLQPFMVTCPNGSGYSFSLNEKLDLPGVGNITIADIDGDGKADVIRGGETGLSVFRNTSSIGTLSFAPGVDLPVTTNKIFAADVDGDGRLDLIASETGAIFRNTSTIGNISFAAPVNTTADVLAVADFDGDGKPDLVRPGTIRRNLSGPGNISFSSAINVPVLNIAYKSVAIGDVNGDGKADLVALHVVNDGYVRLGVFQNTSSPGNFSFALRQDLPPSQDGKIILADIDGDGKLDIAAMQSGPDVVSIYKNQSAINGISFTPSVDYNFYNPNSHYLEDMAIGDYTGDGKPDLVISHGIDDYDLGAGQTYPPKYVDLLINTSTTGTISFNKNSIATGPPDYQSRVTPFLALGDLDGDGKADLVVARNVPISTSIFRNLVSCSSTCIPPTFVNNALIILDATCANNDGNINIIPTSGTAPFMYSINGGQTYVAGPNAGYGFQNLAAGTYKLRLKDANGCESAIVERVVKLICASQCTPPTFVNNGLIVLDASCGKSDGAVNIIPISGTAPFMYSINGGATYVAGPNAGYGFQNLPAGTYQLRLKDSRGCESAIVERTVRNYYNCPGVTLNTKVFEEPLAMANKDIVATYPNPNTGQFKLLLQNFQSPKAEVSIFDAKGTLIQKRSLNLTQNTIADFNLKGKAPGLYLIKVVDNNGTKVLKVLIQ